MNTRLCLTLLLAGFAVTARAQFSPTWLQDEKYWGDGKAEFNIYDAVEMRYGKPRKCEILHILVREPFADRDLVKAEPGTKGGTYPVIKLNQILHIPTGVYVYQQMHSAFWRCDTGALVKSTLTSNDSCGNTYKEFRSLGGLRGLFSKGWNYEWRTYWEGMSAGEETIAAPENAVFYDELPLRVRTIDFTKSPQSSVAFEIQLAPSIITSKKGDVSFEPATISWSVGAATTQGSPTEPGHSTKAGNLIVKLSRTTGSQAVDCFVLAPEPPHRLLEWHRDDGGSLTLRKSLKLDYWSYNQPGDLERALKETAQ